MWRSKLILAAVAASILIYQLILPPVVALSDNGDFAKVIRRFGLVARVGQRAYADTVYDFHPEQYWVSGFRASEILLAFPALTLNRVLSKDGSFDIRFIGVVHSAVFLLALWLLVPLLLDMRPWARWLVCVLILFVFTDVMYVAGLNSFYMDEPVYVFLLLSTVLYLRLIRWHSGRDAALLAVSLFLLVGAKTQHALLGFWIAGLLIATRKPLWPKRERYVVTLAACLAMLSALVMWKGSPPHYSDDNVYNIAFYRLLPQSKDVDRTLAELGLDDSYRPHIGKYCYMPGSRMDDENFRGPFRERLTIAKIGVYYLRHPAEMYRDIRASLSEAGRQRLFSNFDRSAGYREYAESRAFALWSDIKSYCFFHQGARYLFSFLIAGALLCVLAYMRRTRLPAGTLPAVLVLTGMAVSELLIASLADALEIARHHLIFFELFDMMLLALVCISLARPGEGRRPATYSREG